MTFWGAEVKPGNPLTIESEELEGTLVLTQATLGTGSATKKSTLQVAVGEKSPVFLCTLLPDKSESCSLNLEFDEDDDVKFSVLGPTSIHLSGFVHSEPENEYDSDTYGEGDSESSDCESEDGYEDDIMDDDDVDLFPSSGDRESGVVIEEIEDDEKDHSEDDGTKQAKKKKKHLADANKNKADQKIMVKTNGSAPVLESEDEDGFPVSPSITEEDTKKNKKDEAKNDDGAKSLKRKTDVDEQMSDAAEADNGDAAENKKKKKQKKKKGKTEKDAEAATVKQDASTTDKSVSKTDKVAKESKDKSSKVRTYPNGLIVEEISMGKPNGKRASRGSKVSVHYIGKLQKNNKHFDSNTGKSPFKFRLGIGQVIKGWDVGLEGMRVGDKRRLTIPPSMGYAAAGAPPKIPPNAWLLFDVELVDVA